jgi:antitoxin Phd
VLPNAFSRYPIEPAVELSISDARNHFADVVSSAQRYGHITYVTRRGRRLAAVVPAAVAEHAERASTRADITTAEAAMLRIEAGEAMVGWSGLRDEVIA